MLGDIKSVKLAIIIFVLLARVDSWCELTKFQESGTVTCIDYSFDRQYIATTTSSGVKIWQGATKQLLYTVAVNNAQCA